MQIVLGVAVVVWAVLLFVEVFLKATYLKPYSVVVTVLVIGLILFDRWLWRMPGVSRLVRHPILQGNWKGRFDPTGKTPLPSGHRTNRSVSRHTADLLDYLDPNDDGGIDVTVHGER